MRRRVYKQKRTKPRITALGVRFGKATNIIKYARDLSPTVFLSLPVDIGDGTAGRGREEWGAVRVPSQGTPARTA